MGGRRRLAEAVVRFTILCLALALLSNAYGAWRSYQEKVSSSFRPAWGDWTVWVAFLAAAGFAVGLACLPGRPGRYRAVVPLVVTIPALILLAHYVALAESLGPDGSDLPWILGRPYFYMDAPSQSALALIAGFGLAGGFREGREVAERGPGSGSRSDDEVELPQR